VEAEGLVYFLAATMAFALANGIKIVLGLVCGERHWRRLVSSGGMPSAHTASIAALAVTIGIQTGFASAVFALSVVMTAVIAYDATHVRRSVGEQGEALSKMLSKGVRKPYKSDGHTYAEVLAGALLGVLVGIVVAFVYG